MRNYKSRIKTLAIRENPLLCRRPDTYSFLVGEPLINLPFCPDNAILAGFSGSFARCPLSAILGYHYRSLICLTRQKVNPSTLRPEGRSLLRVDPERGLAPPNGSTAKTPRSSPAGTPSAPLLHSHRAILCGLDCAVCSFPQHALP